MTEPARAEVRDCAEPECAEALSDQLLLRLLCQGCREPLRIEAHFAAPAGVVRAHCVACDGISVFESTATGVSKRFVPSGRPRGAVGMRPTRERRR